VTVFELAELTDTDRSYAGKRKEPWIHEHRAIARDRHLKCTHRIRYGHREKLR